MQPLRVPLRQQAQPRRQAQEALHNLSGVNCFSARVTASMGAVFKASTGADASATA